MKNYGSKKDIRQPAPEVCAGTIEYKMSKALADSIIGKKKNKNPQELLCNFVNSECGLKGYCVKVLVDLE